MTRGHVLLWLGTVGASGCIALGVGCGVASADTDSSDSPTKTSQSSYRDAQRSNESRASASTDTDTGDADSSTDTGDADTSASSDGPAQARLSAEPDTIDLDTEATEDTVDLDAVEDTEDADDLSAIADEVTEEGDDVPAAPTRSPGTPATADATIEPVTSTGDEETDTASGTDRSSDSASTPTAEPVTAAAEPETTEAAETEEPAVAAAAAAVSTVTGVQTGRSTLTIPIGPHGFTTRADWYFPTQADGSVQATGVIWLQHGFLARNWFYSDLAQTLSQQTNSIVVAPNLPSFPALLRCGGCWINDPWTQQAVASMFDGDEASLTASANAAGLVGALPQDFVLSGHSAGGGFATATGGYYAADPDNNGNLRGVVMYDGVSFAGLTGSLQDLDDPYIPVYQIAAPPQLWNALGSTTDELVAARPDRFVGVTLANGSHVDAMLGGHPILDFFAQLVTKFSPPGNTAAVHTLATGWINDMYAGLGPTDGTGIYGAPDEYIVLGDAAAVVLAPPPVVDVDRYLGTWYEVGSVKQFFSIGLVNTTAEYSLNPDDSIRVVNSGNYFFNNGPLSRIVGAALPVNADNNKLNVSFFGPVSANPPGNYWIVDLDPDYEWAIVSDPTGFSGFLLSRTRTVSDDQY
ncbi:MAG: lipocalin family protein, partial [Actinomycetota bacterium]|nr:lipocalin family protein [Actinomycetota bacterium]